MRLRHGIEKWTCGSADPDGDSGCRRNAGYTGEGADKPRGMAMLIDPLKLTQPLAAFNGGVLIKPDLKTVVDQKFLPAGVPEKVIEAIANHGLDVWVYTDTVWFVRD